MHPNLDFCLRYSAAWMKATVWGDGGSYIGFVVDKSVWTSYPPTAQSVCLVGGCVDTASEDYMGESGCVQNNFHNTLPPLEKKETRLSPLRYEVELAWWWGGESVIWDWTFLWTEIARWTGGATTSDTGQRGPNTTSDTISLLKHGHHLKCVIYSFPHTMRFLIIKAD